MCEPTEQIRHASGVLIWMLSIGSLLTRDYSGSCFPVTANRLRSISPVPSIVGTGDAEAKLMVGNMPTLFVSPIRLR